MSAVRKRATSLEFLFSKKRLPLLNIPYLGKVGTQEELSIAFLKEQNRNLCCKIKQLCAQEATLNDELDNLKSKYEIKTEVLKRLRLIIKNVYQRFSILKDCLEEKSKEVTLYVNFYSVKEDLNSNEIKSEPPDCKNSDDADDEEFHNIVGRFIESGETILFDEIENVITTIMREFSSEFGYNGIQKTPNSDTKSPLTKDLINMILSNDNSKMKKELDNLRIEYEKLKSHNFDVQKSLSDTLYDINILQHKVCVLHERYEEKMLELDKQIEKTKLMNEEKQQILESNIKSNQNSTAVDDTKCEKDEKNSKIDHVQIQQLKDEISNKLLLLDEREKSFTSLQIKYDELWIQHEKLNVAHNLVISVPILENPEYKSLKNKYEEMMKYRNSLEDKLAYIWKIFFDLRSDLNVQLGNLQVFLDDHIDALLKSQQEIETELIELKTFHRSEKLEFQKQQDAYKQNLELLDESRKTVEQLRTQNAFYAEKLKKTRQELYDETMKEVDEKEINNTIIDQSNAGEIKSHLLNLQSTIFQLKNEQQSIVSEMEITEQSYEETFEQNKRLQEMLKLKQDANLKISADLFKSHQVIQTKDDALNVLKQQIGALEAKQNIKNQLSHYANLVESLKSEIYKLSIKNMEQQNALDNDKTHDELNKAINSIEMNAMKLSQLIEENSNLKLQTQKSAQAYSVLEAEISQLNKANEELKNQISASAKDLKQTKTTLREETNLDDVAILTEEINMYKTKLKCSCCNNNAVDAILNKCFHLFCYTCLQNRYEARQRKCPRCNMPFGQQDYHKIYF